jgi:hypothetical protein
MGAWTIWIEKGVISERNDAVNCPLPCILISNLIDQNAANSDGNLSSQIPELTKYDTEMARTLQMPLADSNLEIILSRKRCDP